MEIITNNGTIFYNEQIFVTGQKRINLEISKKNLLEFREIMLANNIKFGLIFGTLLGAIRENNFIKHDEDTDIYILEENREAFLDTLIQLQKKGFIVGRYIDSLLSIIKDEEYIDIYFFKKRRFGYRICNGEVIKEKYLVNTIEYNFIGKSFNIPKDYEKLLIYLFGKDWKIPKVNAPSFTPRWHVKLIFKLKKYFPTLYLIARTIKKKINL